MTRGVFYVQAITLFNIAKKGTVYFNVFNFANLLILRETKLLQSIQKNGTINLYEKSYCGLFLLKVS